MAGIVVIFDFDKTIIDIDSDNWVIDGLGVTDMFDQLLPTMPWNSAMVCFSSMLITPSVSFRPVPSRLIINIVQIFNVNNSIELRKYLTSLHNNTTVYCLIRGNTHISYAIL